jgi:hypothetical protein
MKTELTVFVCSTYSDLSAEREAVLDAIRRLQLQHDSMEFFGARAGQPIETCLAEVRRSNILVVIVGHRYGTMVPDSHVSFSEAEYAEGYRLKKPCLVYIRNDDVPVLPKHMERDPDKLKLLDAWKQTLQSRHTVAGFRDGNDLAVQVAADLSRTINELEEAARTREEARAQPERSVPDELAAIVFAALNTGVTEAALLSGVRRAVSALVAEVEHIQATVFLSYANADRDIVRKVAEGLSMAGVRVWFDETSLKAGSSWVREIERGLDTADFVIFFISAQSIQSNWARQELQIALHRKVSGEGGAFILPVLLEHTEVPPLLRDIQWLDMTDKNVDNAVTGLLTAINHFSRSRRRLSSEANNND